MSAALRRNWPGLFIGLLLGVLLFAATLVSAQTATPRPLPTPPPKTACVVNPKSAAQANIKPAFYKGRYFFFCCESCRYQFAKKPAKFAAATVKGAQP